MSGQDELNFEGIERLPLRTFTEKAYLEYSMYVILDRALPHVGEATVDLVFDPPWDRSRISEAAQLTLGL